MIADTDERIAALLRSSGRLEAATLPHSRFCTSKKPGMHGLAQGAEAAILRVSYFGLVRQAAMPVSERRTTTVSTKGQVILPKAIRQTLRWEAGTRLVVESTPEGVLLKPAPLFPETRGQDVFGCLAHKGAPRTLAEMEAGIVAEARRRHAGG